MRTLPLVACLSMLTAACSSGERDDVFDIPDGATLYARHCSACHGQFGDGDGPVAIAMSVAVPSLRDLTRREEGTFPRESMIEYIDGRALPTAHGDRYMPVWGDVFRWGEAEEEGASEAEIRARIEALTDFIERMQN
jgi:mono/diheme cytochrome c family protein